MPRLKKVFNDKKSKKLEEEIDEDEDNFDDDSEEEEEEEDEDEKVVARTIKGKRPVEQKAEPEVKLVTEQQLLNAKLDHIIYLLEKL